MNQNNHGINWTKELAEQSDEDWMYGAAFLQSLVNIPERERINYLPKGEIQKGVEDMMDCATRSPMNDLETDFNYLVRNNILSKKNIVWLKENQYINENGDVEFSDAFIAIKSGTTRTGNSLKAPLRAIENNGLIPKKILPLESWMTFNDYHDPSRIKGWMEDLGKEFKIRFPINYQKVYANEYHMLIKQDSLCVAGYSWLPPDKDGVYQRTDLLPNHAFKIFEGYYRAFDNYVDSFDGDFIKNLAPNYKFSEHGYRLTVNESQVSPRKYGSLKKIWLSIRRYLGL